MKQLTIKQQIILTLGLVVSALIAVGSIGLWKLSGTLEVSRQLSDSAAESITAIDTARGAQVNFKKQVQEWKNVLLRGNDPKMFTKYKGKFDAQEKQVQKKLNTLREMVSGTPALQQQIDTLLRTHASLGKKYRSALQHYDSADPEAAHIVDKLVKGIDRPPTKQMDALIEAIRNNETATLEAMREQQLAAYDRTFNSFVWIIALCSIGALLLTAHLIRSITRPLARAMKLSDHLARGDLTYTIASPCSNELGQLIESNNTVARNLSGAVGKIAECATEVENTSQLIASENSDLAQRTSLQANSLEETAHNMRSITSVMQDNANYAAKAKELVNNARNQAVDGADVVGQVMTAMDDIKVTSTRISDINNVIDEIAFQTNLLALNAAVEAARAGDDGEVRALAQRSAAAAREIKELIADSVSKVSTGSELADESGRRLQEIVATVNEASSLIVDIAAATEEQAAGISQVNAAIAEMDTVTQQNTALVEQVAEASSILKSRAATLQELIGFFKVASDGGKERQASARTEGYSGPERRKADRPWSQPSTPTSDSEQSWQEANG